MELALPHALRWNSRRDLAQATPQLSDKCSGFIIPLSSLRPVQACGWSLRHKAGSCGSAEPICLPFWQSHAWYHIGTTCGTQYSIPIFWCHFRTSPHSPGSSFQESREAWILRSSPWVCHGQDLTYFFHSHTKHDQTCKKSTHRSSQLHLGWATKHQTFHGRTSKRPRQRLDSPGFILQQFCRFGTINFQYLSQRLFQHTFGTHL